MRPGSSVGIVTVLSGIAATQCRRTFTDDSTRPADRRRLALDKTVLCLRMLLEGNSIRSVERLTGVHRDTIIDAMVEAGQKCKRFLEATIRHVPVEDVQADEVWGFVGCNEKTTAGHGYDEDGRGRLLLHGYSSGRRN